LPKLLVDADHFRRLRNSFGVRHGGRCSGHSSKSLSPVPMNSHPLCLATATMYESVLSRSPTSSTSGLEAKSTRDPIASTKFCASSMVSHFRIFSRWSSTSAISWTSSRHMTMSSGPRDVHSRSRSHGGPGASAVDTHTFVLTTTLTQDYVVYGDESLGTQLQRRR